MIKQKSIWLMILFLPVYALSAGQSKNIIIKSYPFYFITTPGDFPKGGNDYRLTIQADSTKGESDNSVLSLQQKDTAVIIYVETNTLDIIWDSALIGYRHFNIIALPQQELVLNPGFLISGKQVNISRSKKNHFFLLQLSGSKNNAAAQKLNVFRTIALKGKYKGKSFNYKTGIPKQIKPLSAS